MREVGKTDCRPYDAIKLGFYDGEHSRGHRYYYPRCRETRGRKARASRQAASRWHQFLTGTVTSRKTLASTSGDHLRIQRPVAAVPGVAHLVPSVAPLAHTNEIRASSSAQRTVSVPVTTRRACADPGSPFGPGGPAGPCEPCAPGGPAGPGGPCAPGGPAGPCGPSAPPGPAGPCGPSLPPGPAGPCGPCAPGGPAGPCGPSLPPGPAGPCGPDAGWPHPATARVMMMRTEMLTSRMGRDPPASTKCALYKCGCA